MHSHMERVEAFRSLTMKNEFMAFPVHANHQGDKMGSFCCGFCLIFYPTTKVYVGW